MADRVDDTSSSQPAASVGQSDRTSEADETTTASETESPEGTGTTPESAIPGERDVWEEASTPYGEFMEGPTPDPGAAVGPESGQSGEEMAVWEMMGDAQKAAGDQRPDLSDNAVANQLAGMYDQLAEGEIRSGEFGTEFNIQIFDDLNASGRGELIELAGRTDELEQRLLERGGDEDLARTVVDEVQSRVVSMAGERIAERARPHIREGMEMVQSINGSSEARRALLAQVAERADGPDQISEALQQLGVSPSEAEDIAGRLVEIAADDEQMAAFIRGEEGEQRWMGLAAGEFDSLEDSFADELDSIEEGLESLESSLTRDQIQHDRFLTDPTVAPFRDEVLEEMGAVTDPPEEVNGLGEVFNEAVRDSEFAQKVETVAEVVITAAGGAAGTVASGGTMLPMVAAAVGGAGGAALQELPNLAEASQDVDRARGEVAADLASPQLVEQAERDETVARGIAVANVLAGGALGAAGTDEAARMVGDSARAEGISTGVEAGGGAAVDGGSEAVERVVTGDRDE